MASVIPVDCPVDDYLVVRVGAATMIVPSGLDASFDDLAGIRHRFNEVLSEQMRLARPSFAADDAVSRPELEFPTISEQECRDCKDLSRRLAFWGDSRMAVGSRSGKEVRE